MQVLKTLVGHHLLNMFPENVAFHIATFLVEDEEENSGQEQYKLMVANLYGATKKNKKS